MTYLSAVNTHVVVTMALSCCHSMKNTLPVTSTGCCSPVWQRSAHIAGALNCLELIVQCIVLQRARREGLVGASS